MVSLENISFMSPFKLPERVILGLQVACPWESLLGEACLVLHHPWHANLSQHHVDNNDDDAEAEEDNNDANAQPLRCSASVCVAP